MLVTGGAMGIGESVVRRFTAEGACVVIADIATEKGQALADEIGDAALFVRHDVTDEPGWHATIKAALTRFGKLNVVVNNAGVVSLGTAESVTDGDWTRHMALHLDGTVLGCRLGLAAIRVSGEPGSIVNIASTSTVRGYSAHYAYLAGKGAVRGLTRSAACLCTDLGLPIRFNCIIPGGILTPMADVFAVMARTMPEDVQFATSAGSADRDQPIDLSVLGEPDDVGNLALYLGSDESRFVNGADFVVDGGATRRPPLRSLA